MQQFISDADVILRRAKALRGTVRRRASAMQWKRPPHCMHRMQPHLRHSTVRARKVPHAGFAAIQDDIAFGGYIANNFYSRNVEIY